MTTDYVGIVLQAVLTGFGAALGSYAGTHHVIERVKKWKKPAIHWLKHGSRP